jgi:hypothetical protein
MLKQSQRKDGATCVTSRGQDSDLRESRGQEEGAEAHPYESHRP